MLTKGRDCSDYIVGENASVQRMTTSDNDSQQPLYSKNESL